MLAHRLRHARFITSDRARVFIKTAQKDRRLTIGRPCGQKYGVRHREVGDEPGHLFTLEAAP